MQILNKERELDAVKTRNEYLLAQIRDTVEKHKKEEEDLQVTVICYCSYLHSLYHSHSRMNMARFSHSQINLLCCVLLQQERIEASKLDLKMTKEKIALLLREHQDLLNVKMALEIEITTYR